jgi:uncharacterized protein (TIGR00725 family)
MRRTVVGVMGPGSKLADQVARDAYEIGKRIANRNWVLLTGGRRGGVMDEASRGAAEGGGLVIGVLPDDDDRAASNHVSIAINTGMGSARNNINVLSSHVVVACGLGAGTGSEICLALKAGKPVVLLSIDEADFEFFKRLDKNNVFKADSPTEAETIISRLLKNPGD